MDDKDRFMPPRPYWATDEEYEAIQKDQQRKLLEAGWRRFMEAVEAEGTDPEASWLHDLVAEGVPDGAKEWAIEYMSRRLAGEDRQSGRPKTRPDNLHVPDDHLYASTGGLPPDRAFAVWHLRRCWAEYKDDNPSPYLTPKEAALRDTADKLDLDESSLDRWDLDAADWYGPDVD